MTISLAREVERFPGGLMIFVKIGRVGPPSGASARRQMGEGSFGLGAMGCEDG